MNRKKHTKTLAKSTQGTWWKEKKNWYMLAGLVLTTILLAECPILAYAQEETGGLGAITSPLNNLLNLVSTVVSAMGSIIALWGISEWGLSLQGGNGGMMEAQGFKRIIGGIVMILAPNLLTIFSSTSS